MVSCLIVWPFLTSSLNHWSTHVEFISAISPCVSWEACWCSVRKQPFSSSACGLDLSKQGSPLSLPPSLKQHPGSDSKLNLRWWDWQHTEAREERPESRPTKRGCSSLNLEQCSLFWRSLWKKEWWQALLSCYSLSLHTHTYTYTDIHTHTGLIYPTVWQQGSAGSEL